MTRSSQDKIALFTRRFRGLPDVYGTYDPATGRVRQVKAPVTSGVIYDHLCGRRSYGVYLLVGDRTAAVAADFDTDDLNGPVDLLHAARRYALSAYIERSKSKGYHVWIFFDRRGVVAAKARRVLTHLLEEADQTGIEVFPKQDRLAGNTSFGNFINAPLFGRLVRQGRTVFMDPADPTKVHPDQWALLEGIDTVSETLLDEIIDTNGLDRPETPAVREPQNGERSRRRFFALPPCARRMLRTGVPDFQRVSCFRLAVNLKRTGLPFDMTVLVLRAWAARNRPADGKGVITDREIHAQAACAYRKDYRGLGCQDPAIRRYCDRRCPIHRTRSSS